MSNYEKPCPFCGSTNLKSGGDDKIVGTWCLDCEATGPNHYGRYEWNDRAGRIEELEAKHTELVSAVSDLLCDVRYSILDEHSADGEGYDLWEDVKKFRRVIHAAGLAELKGQDDE